MLRTQPFALFLKATVIKDLKLKLKPHQRLSLVAEPSNYFRNRFSFPSPDEETIFAEALSVQQEPYLIRLHHS